MLLLDTDMLVLLTASGNLEKVAARLGYAPDQIRRLPASIHQVRKSAKFRNVYGEAVLQRIAPIIEHIATAPAPDDIALLDTLHEVVDEGEAMLMATAAPLGYTLLASGDKRAIKDLAKSEAAECIHQLQGRIVTLEAILWLLVTDDGAAKVRGSFQPVSAYGTLRVVLSEHATADDKRCLEGIRAYFDELSSTVGGLLYNPAPDRLDVP